MESIRVKKTCKTPGVIINPALDRAGVSNHDHPVRKRGPKAEEGRKFRASRPPGFPM